MKNDTVYVNQILDSIRKIDLDVVWDTVVSDIPVLKNSLFPQAD